MNGDVDQILLLFGGFRNFDINKYFDDDTQNRNPLCCCVESGSVEAVATMLSMDGVDINYNLLNSKSPLTIAIRRKDLRMIEFLLDEGANPNQCEEVPLIVAAISGSDKWNQIIQILFKKSHFKIDLEKKHHTGRTVFDYCSSSQTKELLALKVDEIWPKIGESHYV